MPNCKRIKVLLAAFIFLGVIMVAYTGYPSLNLPESAPNSFLENGTDIVFQTKLPLPQRSRNNSETLPQHRGQREMPLRNEELSSANASLESPPKSDASFSSTKQNTPILPPNPMSHQVGQSLLSPEDPVTQRGYPTSEANDNDTNLHPNSSETFLETNFLSILPNTEDVAVTALYDGQTIAVVESQSSNISKCTLIEANKRSDAEKELHKLSAEAQIQPITMRDMIQLISLCQKLDQSNVDASWNAWTFLSGIVPGTKWCGPGDIAKNYDDLGPLTDLDKCCRAHDHCPLKLKAFRAGFGLVNFSLFTKSHCDCDGEFYRCLKEISSPVSLMLGRIYFNILQIPCVADEPCTSRDGGCARHASQSSRARRMRYAKHLVF